MMSANMILAAADKAVFVCYASLYKVNVGDSSVQSVQSLESSSSIPQNCRRLCGAGLMHGGQRSLPAH